MSEYARCSCGNMVTYPERKPVTDPFVLGCFFPTKHLKTCRCDKPCPKCGKTTHPVTYCPRNFGKLGLGAGKKPKKGGKK